VTSLQNYLVSAGYLTATPTGYFGSQTKSALKAFQAANGITATGQTGPLTRAAISQKSCAVATTAITTTSTTCPTGLTCTANTTANATVTTSASPVVTEVVNTNVTSPLTGQVLSIGSSTVIRWNNTPSGIYNINLEEPGGTGAGSIALNQSSNTSNPNQYVWSVGKVYTFQSSSGTTVSPGTYRIRLQNSVSGISANDQTSGWFTIVAQQFGVSSVVPSSAYADNTTSVVLFGTGFTNSTSVYFDSNYSSYKVNSQYVSADGTIMVFTIPTNVPAGSHTLYINNNGYNSSSVTLPFTVLSVQ
jgi:hypothetical protein